MLNRYFSLMTQQTRAVGTLASDPTSSHLTFKLAASSRGHLCGTVKERWGEPTFNLHAKVGRMLMKWTVQKCPPWLKEKKGGGCGGGVVIKFQWTFIRSINRSAVVWNVHPVICGRFVLVVFVSVRAGCFSLIRHAVTLTPRHGSDDQYPCGAVARFCRHSY